MALASLSGPHAHFDAAALTEFEFEIVMQLCGIIVWYDDTR